MSDKPDTTKDDDTRRLEQESARKAQYEEARGVEARRQDQAKADQQKQADQGEEKVNPLTGKSDADRFRLMIRNSLAHMTPEQRTCVAEEVARVQLVDLAKVPQPHAELQANEADKVKRAEEAVRPRIPPAPPVAGEEGTLVGAGGPGDVLDMSQYEKVGEQWRMCLGSVAGQMQYRWLSTAEATSLGLEPPKGVNERIDQLYQGEVPPLDPASSGGA